MSREILAPPLQSIGDNRCYRVNLVHEDFGGHQLQQITKENSASSTKQVYMEQYRYNEDDEDDDDSSYNIEELPNGFKLTMHVAPSLFGGLIGHRGSTKRRIESETRTEIVVPRNKDTVAQAAYIIIKGQLRVNVCAARRKINLLVASLRKRMRPTHFLSVSLKNEELKEGFIKFKKEVLGENYPGIDEQLFQKETYLHLTLCTCVLLDDTDRAKAFAMLQDCRQFLADLKTPFDIEVSGLEIMNDDPSSVRVVYGIVSSPDLQQFANRISRHFVDCGLCNEDRDYVKLHMTLLNNRFRKEFNENKAENFDARGILKRHGNFHFGVAQCNEVQLCIMGTKGEGDDGFYKVSGELKF